MIVINERARSHKLLAGEEMPQGVWVRPGANELPESYLTDLLDRDAGAQLAFEHGRLRFGTEADRPWTADYDPGELKKELARVTEPDDLQRCWLLELRAEAREVIEERIVALAERDG
jgi:hypothetical protein